VYNREQSPSYMTRMVSKTKTTAILFHIHYVAGTQLVQPETHLIPSIEVSEVMKYDCSLYIVQ
jgi:hypothetical protein